MFVVIVAAAAAAAGGAAFAASVWSKCYKFEVLKQISNGLFLIYDRPYIREQTYHTKAGWLAGHRKTAACGWRKSRRIGPLMLVQPRRTGLQLACCKCLPLRTHRAHSIHTHISLS